MNRFRANPTASSRNLEKIHDSLDNKLWSARVDEAYRAILARQENIFLLLWVAHHDDAYDWAQRKKCVVNHESGAIQVFDIKKVEVEENVPNQKKLFDDLRDKDAKKLGVPEEQLEFLHSIVTKEDFYDCKSSFSNDVFENLSWIAEDIAVTEVLEMLAEQKEENKQYQDDFETALTSPQTLKSFVVIEGEDELRRILAEPLEKWRIFLHPTQRKIVSKTYKASARVLGGAGTGKTVVAMHRAKALASNLEEQNKILFTTYTKNLAKDIEANLSKICTRNEFQKIDVFNLDAWVSKFVKDQEIDTSIVYSDDELKGIWENARQKLLEDGKISNDFNSSFYKDEWERILTPQEAFSKDKYFLANRNGRGKRLDRKKRFEIWLVIEEYMKIMREENKWDMHYAMYECKELILNRYNSNKLKNPYYKHIIVDEGQDFNANAFRLIRALAGDVHENDIFIVGDAHQRIYRNKVVLSKCSIDVRGRSSKLRINYRTTEETRRFAFALLNNIPFDNLDGENDNNDNCQSLMHGEKPIIKNFKKDIDEYEFVLSEIKNLIKNGASLNDICIVSRVTSIVNRFKEKLELENFQTYEITRDISDKQSEKGVRLATMHRVKGLEFPYVFIVSANEGVIPFSKAIESIDPITEQESIVSERCLFYVAITRAQKQAYITSFNKPSSFLV